MAIPDYQTLMLPLAQYVAGGERSVRDATEFLANKLALSEEDRSQLTPGGRNRVFHSRVSWAGTYLTQAGLFQRPRRGHMAITKRGQDVLAENPARIDNALLRRFPEFQQFQSRTQVSVNDVGDVVKILPANDTSEPMGTPEERIQVAVDELNGALQAELLTRIVVATPTFFELLVIDLMIGMGYGGSHAEAGRHLGASNDGGIDGVINGDPLGLDVVYLQAKRYTPGNSVGRPEVQSFVGSLVGKGAQKGVFITTSSFAQTARQYVASIPHKVILIDGEMLTSLMIRYGVAVRSFQTVELKKLDLDYFGIAED